ncbi:hypothetical protein CLU79DRAFT_522744 [Phycomyces nitens]|nr:hypothetical protein CLU79DRAFT_522744 [Phycomyces nitens]
MKTSLSTCTSSSTDTDTSNMSDISDKLASKLLRAVHKMLGYYNNIGDLKEKERIIYVINSIGDGAASKSVLEEQIKPIAPESPKRKSSTNSKDIFEFDDFMEKKKSKVEKAEEKQRIAYTKLQKDISEVMICGPESVRASLKDLALAPEKVSRIIVPKADGNCGFRAIGLAIYKDEEKWPEVKDRMLAKYLQYRDTFYKKRIDSSHDCFNRPSMMDILQDKSTPLPTKHWFDTMDCPQIVADTFDYAVVVYNENHKKECNNTLFLPFASQPVQREPIILYLQNSHFILVERKQTSTRMRWPAINLYHKNIVQQNHFPDFSLVYD